MVLVRGPRATADILNSIRRHENSGEVVTKIILSPLLHSALITEAWEFAQTDVGEKVYTIMEIPVEVSHTLAKMEFAVEVEQGNARNDA